MEIVPQYSAAEKLERKELTDKETAVLEPVINETLIRKENKNLLDPGLKKQLEVEFSNKTTQDLEKEIKTLRVKTSVMDSYAIDQKAMFERQDAPLSEVLKYAQKEIERRKLQELQKPKKNFLGKLKKLLDL